MSVSYQDNKGNAISRSKFKRLKRREKRLRRRGKVGPQGYLSPLCYQVGTEPRKPSPRPLPVHQGDRGGTEILILPVITSC